MDDSKTGDHVVRLESPGPIAWRNVDGLYASQDDPYIEGLSADYADALVDLHPFEHADSDAVDSESTISDRIEDVLSGTLADLGDALESGEFDDALDRVESYEQDNKDRDGAYERIADRRDTLAENEPEDEDEGEDEGESEPESESENEPESEA